MLLFFAKFCCLLQLAIAVPLNSSKIFRNSSNRLSTRNAIYSDDIRPEIVNISVKIKSKDGALKDYQLYNQEDLKQLQQVFKNVSTIGLNLEITIKKVNESRLLLQVQRNSFLIAKNFIRKYYEKDGEPIVRHDKHKYAALPHCYFTGKVLGIENSLVALSLCNGVDGFIEINDYTYSIKTVIKFAKLIHVWHTERPNMENDSMSCGNIDKEVDALNRSMYNYYSLKTRKRFAREIRIPAGQTSSTRYIEVYVVMDYSLYRRSGSNIDKTVMRAINIINYASALYRQLDIYLALVGVEVWSDRNKIRYARANGSRDYDPGMILSEFNSYRHFNINWETGNDNGQLFTAEKFAGGLIGKGSTSGICSQLFSGGVTYDGSDANYIRAATTMAHELGHNLGLIHSNSDIYNGKDCECEDPDDPEYTDCIMHSSSNPYQQSKRWSSCNQERLRNNFEDKNLDHCLKNIPEKVETVGTTSVCGNFFVEAGEECDCGQPADCESKCCDPTTCQLHSNATCATGACCNLETCSLHPKSYPCRPVQDSECDLEETCDGKHEWCPVNTYKRDGSECDNRGTGYCYGGKCNTHNSQCYFIWGVDSAKKSDDICYQVYNNRSRYYGNCGWSSVTEDYRESTVRKNYYPCKTEQDKMCGLLHCQYDKTVVKEPKIKNFPTILYPQPYKNHLCAVTSFDVGYQVYDPGQVPNGAKCDENSMCVNSKCVTIPEQPQVCNCDGHGVCNQFNECHCDIGWAPPFCNTKGLGGSLTSNPPVVEGPNIRLIAGLVAFFCGIVPIGVTIAVVGYCRRHEIKKKVQNLLNRSKYPSSQTTNGHVQRPVVNMLSSNVAPEQVNSKKASISTPVLQSTTNESQQINPSGKLHPSRKAPPPPNISSVRIGNLGPVYENVKAKPAPPPKPTQSRKPLVPPKVLPKPNVRY